MEVFRITNFDDSKTSALGRAVALGTFDGVHLGHQAILREVTQYATENKLTPCAITFKEAPIRWTSPDTKVELITSLNERLLLLKYYGMKEVIVFDFEQLWKTSPEDYLEQILIKKLQAKFLSCGPNHFFGKDKSGSVSWLKAVSQKHEMTVKEVALIKEASGPTISSSLIRKLLKEGNINEVNKYLGHNFICEGTLEQGRQMGREIGFPTLNLPYPEAKVQLKRGVYACYTKIGNELIPSAVNFGIAPTLRQNQTPILESHLLAAPQKEVTYGDTVIIEFVEFIRPEIKFDSIDSLKKQIADDCEKIQAILKQNS